MRALTLTRPDDWHVHFRDGDLLAATVPPIAAIFRRVVAMPNLKPPVRTATEALAYASRLRAAAPRQPQAMRDAGVRQPQAIRDDSQPRQGSAADLGGGDFSPGHGNFSPPCELTRLETERGSSEFTPLPSLYLTDHTTPEQLAEARHAGVIAAKLYPAGATTHSADGVTDIARLGPALAAMAELGLVLQVHGETTDPDCDIFDREAVFVRDTLGPLIARHPTLRVVLEHVTSAAGVAFVRAAGANVAATVTPHHLEVERSDLFRGGLRPHLYCLPVPKTRADRQALLDAVMTSHPRFFLGSDSAPHARHLKESACCAAGVYCGWATLSHYAETFDRLGAMDRLEAFASHFGADFYGVPRNADTITLVRAPLVVPATLPLGSSEVVPYRAGETLAWSVAP